MKKFSLLIIAGLTLLAACKKDPPDPSEPETETGKITVTFSHHANGSALNKDSMMYLNAAGNPYEINEIKYFISDLTLYKTGTAFLVDDWTDKHYVDIDIPSTLTWNVYDPIPVGTYDSITFVFGFTPQKNISYMFVNPPEVNMMWPDFLGGGYHYMMMNGKWTDNTSVIRNFRTHLGIGRVIGGGDTTFVHNNFTARIPGSSFTLSKDQTREINIVMNIESWFATPVIYDHNVYGPDIMENQAAMSIISGNGKDAFTIGYIH